MCPGITKLKKKKNYGRILLRVRVSSFLFFYWFWNKKTRSLTLTPRPLDININGSTFIICYTFINYSSTILQKRIIAHAGAHEIAFEQLDCWLVSGACVALGEQVICDLPKKLGSGSCVTPNEYATSHWPCTQPRALRSYQLASWANQEEHSMMISGMRIRRIYKDNDEDDERHRSMAYIAKFALPGRLLTQALKHLAWTKHGRQLNSEPPSSKTVPCIYLLEKTTRY